MIAAIVLTLATTDAPVPVSTGTDDEIVVVARKLDDWRGKWQLRKGQFSCKTTRSTGDRAIDAVGCSALQVCIEPRLTEFKTIGASKDKRAVQNAKFDALAKSMIPCITDTRARGVAELARQRAGR